MNFQSVSDIGFKSLLSTLPKEKIKDIALLLTENERQRLEKVPFVSTDEIFSDSVSNYIDQIHPSWIHYIFENLGHKDLKLIISAFDIQKKDLEVLFKINIENIEISPLAKNFIRNLAYSKLLQLKEPTFPVYALKEEPLFSTLFLDKELFKNVIFGMGLFDLKDELNTLVDKVKLQTIKEGLDPQFCKFLKEISRDSNNLISQPIGLNFWDGKIEELKTLLHHRGMNRIAKILSSHSSSFYWHFSLILSIEEAKLLKKLMVKSVDPQVVSSLSVQLEKTQSFFKNSDEV